MSVENEKLITPGDTRVSSQSPVVAEPNGDASPALTADETLPIRAEWRGWPRWQFGWWMAAYGFIFTVGGFMYFALTDQKHPWRALIAGLLLPVLLNACVFIGRSAETAYIRYAQYAHLLELIHNTKGDLDRTRQQLSATESLVRDLLVASRRIEIDLVQQINGHVFLTLKPKRSIRLQKGNRIQVVDFTDGAVMGTFQITEIAPVCLAKALGDLNPVWSGYIHQVGVESSRPGNSAAILIESELRENE
jgi:hypothetical protein